MYAFLTAKEKSKLAIASIAISAATAGLASATLAFE
jgi:hypothetical protein